MTAGPGSGAGAGAVSVLAHGTGAQHDLPLSPFYAFAGAFAALFVSFLALGLLWSTSRFRGDLAGRPLPDAVQRAADARPTRIAARALGLAAAILVVLYLLLGPADPDRNPAPGAVYVLLWVGLVPASLPLGPVWRLLNPLRTLHLLACRALGRDPDTGRPLPVRLGMWPAAAGLLAFTWLELVAPDPASPTALLLFLALYSAAHLTGAARHGAHWFDHADAFEVYSGLLARLSPLGRRAADRRLVLRSPFNGLDATPQLPGLVATICVMLGSTAYDGFSDAPSWITTVQTSPLGRTAVATLGLLGAVALVATLYALCAGATGCSPVNCRTPSPPSRTHSSPSRSAISSPTTSRSSSPKGHVQSWWHSAPTIRPRPIHSWGRAVSPPSRSSRSSSVTSSASSPPTTAPCGSSRPDGRQRANSRCWS